MISIDLNRIAVTLWFFFGVLVFCGLLVADAFTVQAITANENLSYWSRMTVASCGWAAFSGFLVDTARFLGTVFWAGKMPEQLNSK